MYRWKWSLCFMVYGANYISTRYNVICYIRRSQSFNLQSGPDIKSYFTRIDSSTLCHTNGTIIEASIHQKRCVCHQNYFGKDCGIPSYIWKTGQNAKLLPKILWRREVARRLIDGLPINLKFDIFGIRMAMQAEVVDVFILHESNYPNSGSVKELKFLQKFQQGWLREYYHKFFYIF